MLSSKLTKPVFILQGSLLAIFRETDHIRYCLKFFKQDDVFCLVVESSKKLKNLNTQKRLYIYTIFGTEDCTLIAS